MKLELEMNLDNAAFRDEDGNLDMESVAWHLDRVVDAIRRGATSFHALMDLNGNRCGSYSIGDRPEDDLMEDG